MSGRSLLMSQSFVLSRFWSARGAQQIAATGHGDPSGARHFQHTERTKHLQQAVDLVHRARNFQDQRFRRDIDDPRPKNLDQFHQMRPGFLICRYLDQCQVALQERALGNIFRQQYVDELFEAGFETVRASLVGVRDDRHAGYFFIVGRADGERIDVDGQASRQRRYAVQHARLVFDISDQCLHDFLGPAHGSGAFSPGGFVGWRIISCSAPPAGTMGYTESSCSTRKSISTLSDDSRAERIVGMTSVREVMRSPRMPKALASAAKSGATSGVAT